MRLNVSFGPTLALGILACLPAEGVLAYTLKTDPGCAAGRGFTWRGGTTSWSLNQAGYSKLDIDTVEAIARRAFDAWGEPCCSSFENQYLGRTATRWSSPSATNVVDFEEVSWPPELGPTVLGMTQSGGSGDCELLTAVMMLNGLDFTYDTAEEGYYDLGSLITHEAGHWLGLLHSPDETAVMWRALAPGVVQVLGPDDIAGVCALYPGSCTSCDTGLDCPGGLACIGEVCKPAPCSTTRDCTPGSICVAGGCFPGCRTHLECGEGESCDDGLCREGLSRCNVCEACEDFTDCGEDGGTHICLRVGGRGICTRSCEEHKDCVGDSICRGLSANGEIYRFCLPPEAPENVLCPEGYRCKVSNGCPALWEACGAGGMGCGGRSDICVDSDDGARCSCTCRRDLDCGEGARCLLDPRTELTSCFPEAAVTPCNGSLCLGDSVCTEEGCVDPCLGVACAPGERCEGGRCVGLCGGCEAGESCDTSTGRCVRSDRCAELRCPSGSACEEGRCTEEPRGRQGKGSGCSAAGGGWFGAGSSIMLGFLALGMRMRGPGAARADGGPGARMQRDRRS